MVNKENPPPDGSSYLLKLQGVTKAYHNRKVLDAISFQLQSGERMALMGPSGSGKSTLLNCISGLDNSDEGQILLGKKDLTQATRDERTLIRRSQIGSIFQFFHLLPTLTALENVALSLQINGHSRTDQKTRAEAMLEEVNIAHRAHAFPRELSGGEMQRVAIARALVLQPKLLLADEPTGNLDANNGERILNLIETLSRQQHVALVMVTHQKETTRICHRTLHLQDGKIVQDSGQFS